jgi:transcriptional regulator with XRE-family HTH domain
MPALPTRPPATETVGERLKRLRLERGLSQRELAAPGVSYAYISRIEAGTRQPSVKALRRLAAKLNVSPDYLETGSDVGPEDARELRLSDAELRLRLEGSSDAEESVAAVLEEALRDGDSVSAARARIALGFAAAQAGRYQEAVERLQAAIAEHRPSALERHDIYATLGQAYAQMGRADRAVAVFENCLDEVTAAAPEDTALQVRYATALSYALSDIGNLGRAEEVLQDALTRAREHEADPYMRVRLYWSLARLSEMEGKSATALQHIRRAIALLEATDDTIHLGRAHILCAWIMTSQGKAQAALEHLDSAEALFGAHPTAEDVAMLKVERARAFAALGDAQSAVGLARDAIEQLGERQPAELGLAFWALGDGLTLQHEIDAANEAYRRAVDLLSEQRRWREATQACQAWGRMLRKSGREEQAFDVLERASELSLHLAPATAGADR